MSIVLEHHHRNCGIKHISAGAIIGDGDRNWVTFSVMGLSLSKKTNVLFLAKIAPYARDARACTC